MELGNFRMDAFEEYGVFYKEQENEEKVLSTVYEGQWSDGEPYGYGILTIPSQSLVHQGKWNGSQLLEVEIKHSKKCADIAKKIAQMVDTVIIKVQNEIVPHGDAKLQRYKKQSDEALKKLNDYLQQAVEGYVKNVDEWKRNKKQYEAIRNSSMLVAKCTVYQDSIKYAVHQHEVTVSQSELGMRWNDVAKNIRLLAPPINGLSENALLILCFYSLFPSANALSQLVHELAARAHSSEAIKWITAFLAETFQRDPAIMEKVCSSFPEHGNWTIIEEALRFVNHDKASEILRSRLIFVVPSSLPASIESAVPRFLASGSNNQLLHQYKAHLELVVRLVSWLHRTAIVESNPIVTGEPFDHALELASLACSFPQISKDLEILLAESSPAFVTWWKSIAQEAKPMRERAALLLKKLYK